MKTIEMHLERLEAMISTWAGQKVMVRVPLVGNAFLAFYGDLRCQEDNDNDPQFLIYRDGAPTLVFYVKDVSIVKPTNNGAPVIDLKKAVDQNQVVE